MTIQIFYGPFSLSLFDRKPHGSYVPTEIQDGLPRRFGAGRPSDQRESAVHRRNACAPAYAILVAIPGRLFAFAALGLLSCSLVAIAGKATQKGATATSSSWTSSIAEASQRFGVPALWIHAVMRLESADDKGAVSPKGAMGLMQVMPETYAELRFRYHLGADPCELRNNIPAGAAYMREMHERFGPGGFLAAYNAGSTASRRDAQLRRRACSRHRRAWHSASH